MTYNRQMPRSSSILALKNSKESQKSAERIINLTGTWVHSDIREIEKKKNTTTTVRKRVVEKLNKALGLTKKKTITIKSRNLLDTVFIPPSDHLHNTHT